MHFENNSRQFTGRNHEVYFSVAHISSSTSHCVINVMFR